MSTPALLEQDASSERTLAEYYLLLGELRMLLDDASPREGHQRWLLAVLDRLLAFWPHDSLGLETARIGSSEWLNDPAGPYWSESTNWWRKLQRLRDRIAHRSAFQFLANEVRCDLKSLFSQESRVNLSTLDPPPPLDSPALH